MPGNFSLPGSGWVVIEQELFMSEAILKEPEVWLYFGNIDFPAEISINGVLLHTRGQFPPKQVYVQSSFPAIIRVPSPVWHSPGTPNKIRLKAWVDGPSLRFPSPVQLAGAELARFQDLVRFLNADFFLMFFGINLMGGLYFLSVWMGRREDKSRLYFAISTLFMALYFYELGSPIPLLPAPLYRAIAKASLSLSVAFVVAFFLEFFKIHNKAWIRNSVIALFTASALYVSLAPNLPEVLERFNFSLLAIEVSILFVIYLLVRALMAKNPEAITLFVGTILSVGFGTHDVIYQVTGNMPLIWLQGLGFFALQGSMFLSLSLQSTRLYITLEDYSKELLVQKEELASTNQAFARFVPKEFLAFLGKTSITDVALGDQVQEHMAILFSDIRDFTSLSESLSPHQNFNLINSYLSRMAPMVRQHGGIIDKYIGDAIMALYSRGAEGAIRSALAMRDTLLDYNAGRFRAGYESLEMGIGVHCGSLMLGTIGDEHRMESTVISDAVNTASRIEGLTKVFRVPIIISEHVYMELSPEVRSGLYVRYLGQLPVRGRTQGLGLYELIHHADRWIEEKMLHRELFEECVRAWELDSAKAVGHFSRYRELFPHDPVLGFFMGAMYAPQGTGCGDD